MTQISSRTQPCLLCQTLIQAKTHPILGGPVCPDCLIQQDADVANKRTAGVGDGLPMFSVEFEVCSCGATRRAHHALILLKHGYLRAYDCTVSDEYKSPIYQSLAAFQEVLPTLESLKDLVGGCCGTHIHIDCPVYDFVHIHYSQLFSLLTSYLETHQEETRLFWGRWPYSFIRIAPRYGTLEFRLPRYKNAEQYLRVVHFCRAVGHLLNTRFNERPSLSPEQIGAEILVMYQRVENSGALEERGGAHV